MKISELPKEIREKALKYQNINDVDLTTDDLKLAFTWANTKQGLFYWMDLDEQEAPKKELKDTIVESVINQFKQRSEVGIKKYGVTLDREDLSLLEWLEHTKQEQMDSVLYLERAIKELKNEK